MSRFVLVAGMTVVFSACTVPETGMIVPANARAGDFVGWTHCVAHAAPASCGTLIVAERHRVADGRLIALPVVRWRATQVAREAPIFWFAGGPGESNLRFRPPASMRERHDVVLVGHRGVDGSTRPECPEARASIFAIGGDLLSREARSGIARAMPRCASRPGGDTVDIADYTIDDVIADVESARIALSYDRVHPDGTVSGQPLAMLYRRRHPLRIVQTATTGDSTGGLCVPALAAAGRRVARTVIANLAGGSIFSGRATRRLSRVPSRCMEGGDAMIECRRAPTCQGMFTLRSTGSVRRAHSRETVWPA